MSAWSDFKAEGIVISASPGGKVLEAAVGDRVEITKQSDKYYYAKNLRTKQKGSIKRDFVKLAGAGGGAESPDAQSSAAQSQVSGAVDSAKSVSSRDGKSAQRTAATVWKNIQAMERTSTSKVHRSHQAKEPAAEQEPEQSPQAPVHIVEERVEEVATVVQETVQAPVVQKAVTDPSLWWDESETLDIDTVSHRFKGLTNQSLIPCLPPKSGEAPTSSVFANLYRNHLLSDSNRIGSQNIFAWDISRAKPLADEYKYLVPRSELSFNLNLLSAEFVKLDSNVIGYQLRISLIDQLVGPLTDDACVYIDNRGTILTDGSNFGKTVTIAGLNSELIEKTVRQGSLALRIRCMSVTAPSNGAFDVSAGTLPLIQDYAIGVSTLNEGILGSFFRGDKTELTFKLQSGKDVRSYTAGQLMLTVKAELCEGEIASIAQRTRPFTAPLFSNSNLDLLFVQIKSVELSGKLPYCCCLYLLDEGGNVCNTAQPDMVPHDSNSSRSAAFGMISQSWRTGLAKTFHDWTATLDLGSLLKRKPSQDIVSSVSGCVFLFTVNEVDPQTGRTKIVGCASTPYSDVTDGELKLRIRAAPSSLAGEISKGRVSVGPLAQQKPVDKDSTVSIQVQKSFSCQIYGSSITHFLSDLKDKPSIEQIKTRTHDLGDYLINPAAHPDISEFKQKLYIHFDIIVKTAISLMSAITDNATRAMLCDLLRSLFAEAMKDHKERFAFWFREFLGSEFHYEDCFDSLLASVLAFTEMTLTANEQLEALAPLINLLAQGAKRINDFPEKTSETAREIVIRLVEAIIRAAPNSTVGSTKMSSLLRSFGQALDMAEACATQAVKTTITTMCTDALFDGIISCGADEMSARFLAVLLLARSKVGTSEIDHIARACKSVRTTGANEDTAGVIRQAFPSLALELALHLDFNKWTTTNSHILTYLSDHMCDEDLPTDYAVAVAVLLEKASDDVISSLVRLDSGSSCTELLHSAERIAGLLSHTFFPSGWLLERLYFVILARRFCDLYCQSIKETKEQTSKQSAIDSVVVKPLELYAMLLRDPCCHLDLLVVETAEAMRSVFGDVSRAILSQMMRYFRAVLGQAPQDAMVNFLVRLLRIPMPIIGKFVSHALGLLLQRGSEAEQRDLERAIVIGIDDIISDPDEPLELCADASLLASDARSSTLIADTATGINDFLKTHRVKAVACREELYYLLNYLQFLRTYSEMNEENEFMQGNALLQLMETFKRWGLNDRVIQKLDLIIKLEDRCGNHAEAATAMMQRAELMSWETDSEQRIEMIKGAAKRYESCDMLEQAIAIHQTLMWRHRLATYDMAAAAEELQEISRITEKRLSHRRVVDYFFYIVAFHGTGFGILSDTRWIMHSQKRILQLKTFFEKLYPGSKVEPEDRSMMSKADGKPERVIQIITTYPSSLKDWNGKRKLVEAKGTPIMGEIGINNRDIAAESALHRPDTSLANALGFPVPDMLPQMPEHLARSYDYSSVTLFCHERPAMDDEKWTNTPFERAHLFQEMYWTLSYQFPSIICCRRVIQTQITKLTPLELALDVIDEGNAKLRSVIQSMRPIFEKRSNNVDPSTLGPLSMVLSGQLDAAINGGPTQYLQFFFHPDFWKSMSEPLKSETITTLRDLQRRMEMMLDLQKEGIILHGSTTDVSLKPFQEHLEDLYRQIKARFDQAFDKVTGWENGSFVKDNFKSEKQWLSEQK